MSNCKYCHCNILTKHKTISNDHEKCTMDCVTRSKLGLCTRCGIPVGTHKFHICKKCWEAKSDFTNYYFPWY